MARTTPRRGGKCLSEVSRSDTASPPLSPSLQFLLLFFSAASKFRNPTWNLFTTDLKTDALNAAPSERRRGRGGEERETRYASVRDRMRRAFTAHCRPGCCCLLPFLPSSPSGSFLSLKFSILLLVAQRETSVVRGVKEGREEKGI